MQSAYYKPYQRDGSILFSQISGTLLQLFGSQLLRIHIDSYIHVSISINLQSLIKNRKCLCYIRNTYFSIWSFLSMHLINDRSKIMQEKHEEKFSQTKCQSTDLSYLPNPSARAGCDTRSISKRSFPSPRLVASPRLKKSVCPTIYP